MDEESSRSRFVSGNPVCRGNIGSVWGNSRAQGLGCFNRIQFLTLPVRPVFAQCIMSVGRDASKRDSILEC